MRQDPLLYIVCPRQMRPQPIMMACVMLPLLVAALAGSWKAGAWPSFVVGLFMIALLVGVLYRNLVFRDRLCIVRDQTAWQAPVPFSVDEIVSVRRLPPPGPYSFEARSAWLGLGQGMIEIETSTERFRFGLGLHEYAVEPTMERIAAFCSLRARPGPGPGALPGWVPSAGWTRTP